MSLAVSAVLIAALAGGALVLVRLVTGGPSPVVIILISSAVALVGSAAGLVAGARRISSGVLVVALRVAAVAVVSAVGLVAALLVLGRLPDAAEHAVVGPVVVGVVLVAVVAGSWVRQAALVARRVSGGSDRLPDELLAVFADRAAGGAPLPELLRELAESLRRSWQLSAVELWTGDGDSLALVLSIPDRGATVTTLDLDDLGKLRRVTVSGPGWLHTWLPQLLEGRDGGQLRLAPAVYGENVLALVVIERDADADRFGEPEERALTEVARRLSTVLRNRDLDEQLRDRLHDLRRINAELRASRARLVAAADAERRRIELDLHDGAQQHLVALAVGLGLLRSSLRCTTADVDDSDWVAMLGDLEQRVDRTINDLRDLAHGIYPSLLRDSGLAEALRAVATRNMQMVTVEVSDVGRHAPEVEAAVYFCCLEALQNAAKHARGAKVTVQAWTTAGELHFSVADDGPGFDPASTSTGAGLQNMGDRLGAVGGSMTCASTVGAGTTVLGRVPVGAGV